MNRKTRYEPLHLTPVVSLAYYSKKGKGIPVIDRGGP
jgi:hypothetical protein